MPGDNTWAYMKPGSGHPRLASAQVTFSARPMVMLPKSAPSRWRRSSIADLIPVWISPRTSAGLKVAGEAATLGVVVGVTAGTNVEIGVTVSAEVELGVSTGTKVFVGDGTFLIVGLGGDVGDGRVVESIPGVAAPLTGVAIGVGVKVRLGVLVAAAPQAVTTAVSNRTNNTGRDVKSLPRCGCYLVLASTLKFPSGRV